MSFFFSLKFFSLQTSSLCSLSSSLSSRNLLFRQSSCLFALTLLLSFLFRQLFKHGIFNGLSFSRQLSLHLLIDLPLQPFRILLFLSSRRLRIFRRLFRLCFQFELHTLRLSFEFRHFNSMRLQFLALTFHFCLRLLV